MTVESATYISDLNATLPASGDAKSEGDDHIRLMKTVIKATFPNVNGAVSPTDEELSFLSGVASDSVPSGRGIYGATTMRFAVGGAEAMRIDANRDFMVGTTTASARVSAAGGASNYAGYFTTAAADNTLAALRLNRSGGTFVGTMAQFEKNGSVVGSISVSGGNVTSYNTTSDERLKENIADAGDSGWPIDAIRIRQFNWKSDGTFQPWGVVAQELHQVVPEAVTVGETWSVDYSKLVPLLVKEVQSLRARVAELEK